MKKIVIKILVSIYVLIVILTTSCLLAFNEHKTSTFGGTSIVIMQEKLDKYNKGDLLISSNESVSKAVKNDEIVYYNDTKAKTSIAIGKIKNYDAKRKIFYLENNASVVNKNVIGLTKDTSSIAKLGYFVKVIESKLGYLLIVILPMFMVFLYELLSISKELKKAKSK